MSQSRNKNYDELIEKEKQRRKATTERIQKLEREKEESKYKEIVKLINEYGINIDTLKEIISEYLTKKESIEGSRHQDTFSENIQEVSETNAGKVGW